MELLCYYIYSVFIVCLLYLIMLIRSLIKYSILPENTFIHLAIIMFTCIIPVINVIVALYYSIFLFGKNKITYNIVVKKLN